MTNFTVKFSLPWLLLLIIPVTILALYPYFRLAKKYRRTRNRIISIALHLIILVMGISILSGISFAYDLPNKENEIILLVDASYSNLNNEKLKDEYVRDVIENGHKLFNMGIVAFGYTQYTVSEPTYETERLLERYQAFRDEQAYERSMEEAGLAITKMLDDTATDISAALVYASNLFTRKAGSKIVVISDGIETDGDAVTTVRQLTSEGIRVDAVSFYGENKTDTEIVDVSLPNYTIRVNEEFTMMLSIRSSFASSEAQLIVRDLNTGDEKISIERIMLGLQQIAIPYTFNDMGMHTMEFEIKLSEDTDDKNNKYYTYVQLLPFNKVLILEGFKGEGSAIKKLLTDENFEVTDVNINPNNGEFDKVPKTVNELRAYDQVILVNVANSDLINGGVPNADGTITHMPVGFDSMLDEYVNVYGGGLFVVGGNELDELDENGYPVAHAFNRSDMGTLEASVFSNMLPVDVIEYTPPIGVVIIIDRSNSMAIKIGGKSRLEHAKDAARSCLDAMSSYRDYACIMTLEDSYSVDTSMLSTRYRSTLESAIDKIEVVLSTGTSYAPAFERASRMLASLTDDQVANRHVILISDGEPTDPLRASGNADGYGDIIERFHNSSDIKFTIVNAGGSQPRTTDLEAACKLGGGEFISLSANEVSQGMLTASIVGLLNSKALNEYDPEEEYVPKISIHNSILKDVDIYNLPLISGFYGTREKEGSATVLRAQYVPLYTQWQYGAGMVGAFMSTLDGKPGSDGAVGSSNFFDDINGRTIIYNIVNGLMPATDISYKDITVTMNEDNYRTRLNITTSVEENESIKVTVTPANSVNDPNFEPQVVYPSAADGYGRATIEIKTPGLHRIVIEKIDLNGETVKNSIPLTIYKTFSYSKEYDVFVDNAAVEEFLSDMAASGNGEVLDAVDEQGYVVSDYIFRSFDTAIHKEYDPRMLFLILSIIFFLLDIAVRKFKFKWPHEIVRDYKMRQELNKKY